MQPGIPKYDMMHRSHNPGSSFTCSERQLQFPNNYQLINDCNLTYHLASKTEKVYSPFQNNYYLPPHLNSSKSHGMIFKGECEAWKIRNTNTRGGQETWKDKEIRGRHVWNSTTNYDVQYRTYEERVKRVPGRNYDLIKPRIRYLIEQDRPGKASRSVNSVEENELNL